MFKKLRKLSKTKWRDLSTGGKIKKLILRLVEIGLVLAVGAWFIVIIAICGFAAACTVAFITGIGDGFVAGSRTNYHNRYW